MAITINGSGTVTGITAGGLPDAIITTAEIVDANITAAKLSGASSGSAPIYGARAWVNFDGTGTIAIRSSGNVSSITDNGAGDYTVNFTIAMQDANYAGVWGGTGLNVYPALGIGDLSWVTTTSIRARYFAGTTQIDLSSVNLAVFR